jgi:hypothetical protein
MDLGKKLLPHPKYINSLDITCHHISNCDE